MLSRSGLRLAFLAILAATLGSAPARAQTSSGAASAEDDWGGHGGWGHGGWHGGRGGGGDGGGTVVIGPYPYPYGGYPYPYPDPTPPPPYPYPYPYPEPPTPLPPPSPAPSSEYTAHAAPPLPVWYYCDQPAGYYPYVKDCTNGWREIPVAPPPPGSPAPVAGDSWEKCDDPDGYFPYVASCHRAWISMEASAPDTEWAPDGGAPEIGRWFYCDTGKGWFPYVQSCSNAWHIVPAMPPPLAKSPAKKTASRR